MDSIFLQCVGVLVLLYTILALRMSLYRVALRGKSSSTNPAAENFYDYQMLTAEWTAPCCAVLIALHLKFASGTAAATASASIVQLAQYAAIVLTATRVIFASKAVWSTMPFFLSFVVMSVCYAAISVAAGLVVFA